MICVYCCMFLQLSLQNQRHFGGEPFVLSGTNVFITGGLPRESIIFTWISSDKHKVNRIVVNYLKWGALTTLTGRICHNRWNFILLPRSQNWAKTDRFSRQTGIVVSLWLSLIRFLSFGFRNPLLLIWLVQYYDRQENKVIIF